MSNEQKLEQKLEQLVQNYYKATSWETRGDYFFTIVDVFNKLKAKGYESKMMTVMQNIIVLG